MAGPFSHRTTRLPGSPRLVYWLILSNLQGRLWYWILKVLQGDSGQTTISAWETEVIIWIVTEGWWAWKNWTERTVMIESKRLFSRERVEFHNMVAWIERVILSVSNMNLWNCAGKVRPLNKWPVKIAKRFYNELVQQRHSHSGSKRGCKTFNNMKGHIAPRSCAKAVTKANVTGLVRTKLKCSHNLMDGINKRKRKWRKRMEQGG